MNNYYTYDDRVERMYTLIGLKASKSDMHPPLTEEEEQQWDKMETEMRAKEAEYKKAGKPLFWVYDNEKD